MERKREFVNGLGFLLNGEPPTTLREVIRIGICTGHLSTIEDRLVNLTTGHLANLINEELAVTENAEAKKTLSSLFRKIMKDDKIR